VTYVPPETDPRWPKLALPVAVFVGVPRPWRELHDYFRDMGSTLGMNALAWLDQRALVVWHGEKWGLTPLGRRWVAHQTPAPRALQS